MNLNNFEIINKIKEIKKQEKELGVKINLNERDIYEGRQDAFWYGGTIGIIEYGDYTIKIKAVGEIRADLYVDGEHVSRILNEDVYKELSYYFETDSDLYDAIEYSHVDDNILAEKNGAPVLFVINNNWLEYDILDKDGYSVGFDDTIIEPNDVLEAFEDIGFYIQQIEEYDDCMGYDAAYMEKDSQI